MVLGGEQIDDRTAALLNLLRVCHMLKHVFTIDEIRAANYKINALLKDEIIGQVVLETVDEIVSAAAAAALAAATS